MTCKLFLKYFDICVNSDPPRRDVAATLQVVAETCCGISALISQGALEADLGATVVENVPSETQKRLDEISNRMLVKACCYATVASEKEEHGFVGQPGARPLVAFDPLDGLSNIGISVSIGTSLAILPSRHVVDPMSDDAFLQPGHAKLAAGYEVYGP